MPTARVAVAQMTRIFIVASIEPPGPETRADGFKVAASPKKPIGSGRPLFMWRFLIWHALQPCVALMLLLARLAPAKLPEVLLQVLYAGRAV